MKTDNLDNAAAPGGLGGGVSEQCDSEWVIRLKCALVASAEYGYWENLPDPGDPILQAMQIAAMGAAANICASIMLRKTGARTQDTASPGAFDGKEHLLPESVRHALELGRAERAEDTASEIVSTNKPNPPEKTEVKP